MGDIKDFIIHLRLHYQFLILSGGYLLASLYVQDLNEQMFWSQFLNVHVLLFGGATAFNSYWDKDEGPIGGLKNPPVMKSWMRPASLLMQFAGLIWAFFAGWTFVIIYGFSMILFWLYSTPLARWKGHPLLSIFAIGVSTGTNSFLMGVLAAGGTIGWESGLIAIGVAALVLSLYPVSQIYQMEEDRKRNDVTFALSYGLNGVKWFYSILFPSGVLLISIYLSRSDETLGLLFGIVSIPAFFIGIYFILKLKGISEEYPVVMKMKFLASLSFVLFILTMLGYQMIFS